MFSVIRLESYVNFYIGKVLQALYFPGKAFVKTENIEQEFLRRFFSNFALLVIRNYDSVSLQIACIGNEKKKKN